MPTVPSCGDATGFEDSMMPEGIGAQRKTKWGTESMASEDSRMALGGILAKQA